MLIRGSPPLGCRVGELVTTRVSDIDLQNEFIRIQSSRRKTGHFRAARASLATLEAIRESIQPGQGGAAEAMAT